jgi:hypothetical protein
VWSFVALALSIGVAPELLAVEGNTECPTAAEVASELRALLGSTANTARNERVALSSSDGGLDIELRSAAGERLATRHLPRVASCGDLASAAAVVIASWQTEVPPLPSATVELVRATPRPPALRYDVGAEFLASLDGNFAPGGLIDATLAPSHSRWGARLGALATATRDQPVGAGHAAWTRAALLLGPRVRLTYKALLVDFDAGLALALLYARGSGFSVEHTSYNIDPGLAAGARLGVRWGPVAPVLGLAVAGWPRRQELDVSGASPATLPQWDLLISAGLVFGAFR